MVRIKASKKLNSRFFILIKVPPCLAANTETGYFFVLLYQKVSDLSSKKGTISPLSSQKGKNIALSVPPDTIIQRKTAVSGSPEHLSSRAEGGLRPAVGAIHESPAAWLPLRGAISKADGRGCRRDVEDAVPYKSIGTAPFFPNVLPTEPSPQSGQVAQSAK